MAITRTNDFQPGTFLKCCSVCGMRYKANQLRRGEDNMWRCLAYCIEVPPITRDKIATMGSKKQEAPPPPHGTPFDRKSAYAAEALIFNFLCEIPVRDAAWPGGIRYGLAPHNLIDVTNGGPGALAVDTVTQGLGYSVQAAGETCRYLYNVINHNLRPLRWISVAKAKLRELADWLITKQRGFGISPASTKTSDGLWGGIASQDPNVGTRYVSADNSAAGLALLYAFRVLGDAKYLVSTKASASFLRNMQAAPNAPYLGTLPLAILSIASISDPFYYPTALIALEFWNELLTTAGDAQYGSDGTPAGFTVIPQQLLSQCIADIRSFWRVGAFDSNAGAVINGLSATTPCEYYIQSGATKAWTLADGGTYLTGSFVTSQSWAIGLRSLFAYEGYSTQVAALWTYLMSYTSNPTFQSAANTLATDYLCAVGTNSANPPTPPAGQGNIIAPSYDPKLALVASPNVRATNNGYDFVWASLGFGSRCTYDWTTFGLLAGIQSSKDQGSFRKAKDAACTTRYRMPTTFVDLPVEETVMLRGSSGLAFQLSHYNSQDGSGNQIRTASAVAAAMIGNAFRYQPQGYTGSAAPGQPYSQKPPGVQY